MCDAMMSEGMSVFEPYIESYVSISRDRIINVRVTMAEYLQHHYRLGSPILMHPEISHVISLMKYDVQDVCSLLSEIDIETDNEELT